MSTSNEQPTPNDQTGPHFETSVQGDVKQLIQIAHVQGSLNLFSPDVIDKLLEAIAAQRGGPDKSLQMREVVAHTLALLRSKNVLYAGLDNEIWEYVFKSLRELRDTLALASSKLHVNGPPSVRSLLDLMVVAIREYLANYESKYTRFMQSGRQDRMGGYSEREWPELGYAARDLLSLRVLLVAAIEPLNAYVEEGQAVHWDQRTSMLRKQQLERARPEPNASITHVDPIAISALIDVLEDKEYSEHAYLSYRAAKALGRIGAPAVPALARAVQDEHFKGRGIAIQVLGNIADARAIPALVEALRDDKNSKQAALALHSIGSAAVPALIEVLEHDQGSMRQRAAEILGEIGDPTALPALQKALEDSDSGVRAAIVRSLGQIGTDAALPILIPALGDTDGWVGSAAWEEIDKIYRNNRPEITPLVDALAHSETRVRAGAAGLLGFIGDPHAVPTLLEASKDASSEVRLFVVRSLGQLKSQTAVRVLIEALEDTYVHVRYTAAQALGEVGDPTAIPALMNALNDTDYTVRERASSALRTLRKLQNS